MIRFWLEHTAVQQTFGTIAPGLGEGVILREVRYVVTNVVHDLDNSAIEVQLEHELPEDVTPL